MSISQLGWLIGYLPGTASPAAGPWPMAGLVLATAAIWFGRCALPETHRSQSAFDHVWLEFRDAYGVLWAMRVADRFNASAALYHWPVRLAWTGLREQANGASARQDVPAQLQADMQQNLKSLLWRFVTPEWIDARHPNLQPSAAT
jgi:hypothetical protein